MEGQTKERISAFIASNKFNYAIISFIFFLVWSNLVIDTEPLIDKWLGTADWFFISSGLMIPFLLLIGVLQYQNSVAYGATLAVFSLAILLNLSTLRYYLKEYYSELENGVGTAACSCCPVCEMKSEGLLILGCFFAMGLMHRNKLSTTFKWRWIYTLQIIVCTLLLYWMMRWW